ncbi:DinB family protein [Flavobacterium silvisoli]|uniref:DinB family protein n=1 Tax=Flavobacterium silvisoli TaxID=2529433 RepID=A0A4Q9YTS2_9FLAO|nr:DinB family protein [Flavobacterium silvisoli]TBX66998.1 DinB family protein [Flavobacterium silvisoli]
MKINTLALVDDLHDRTQKASALVNVFQKLEEHQLRQKTHPEAWSVLECIDHLNRYYTFYLPALKKAIQTAQTKAGNSSFKTGILGQFFVKLMEPKAGKIKKMKALAQMNPVNSNVQPEVLQQFITHQEELLSLLETSRNLNLNAVQVPTAMSKWVTISLGDTFRFIVVHNERHLLQAQNCLKITAGSFE